MMDWEGLCGEYLDKIFRLETENKKLREALECYAAKAEWSSAVEVFLESGEYPNADGDSREIIFEYDLGETVVWGGYGENGYDLAQEVLND